MTPLSLAFRPLVAAAIAWCALVLPASANEALATPELRVLCDFPGGSGEARIDQAQRKIQLKPSSPADLGWQCWWYVKVQGIRPGEMLTVEVGEGPWATPERATFSVDRKSWKHTAAGRRERKTITYTQQIDHHECWLAWGPPFTNDDAEQLVRRAVADCQYASSFELCRSLGDRPVPGLRITQSGVADHERLGVWIQARQHAWESGSSWVCQGLVDWLISDDARAESLRQRSHITIVPVMDVDNVALGAGGKEQKPRDHNRDWDDQPHFPAVRSAMAQIKKMDDAGRFDLFIDLHNPSAGDHQPFFFVAPRDVLGELGKRNLDRFVAATRLEMEAPLKLAAQTHESGENYDPRWQQISKNWVTRHTAEHVTALTLETAWNTPYSTTEGYLTVGRQLGLALERHLRVSPRR